MSKILFTGGSGLLGKEMKKHFPDELFPSSSDFDVTDWDEISFYLQSLMAKGGDIHTLVHLAAFTSPPKIDENPIRALSVNVIGTANMVYLAFVYNLRLVYISTDYVFDGNKGNYTEEDPVNPVNKYAFSKLGGECATRLYDNSLIIRTSFGPNEFPYAAAPVDQWTSREKVSDISSKIAKLVSSDLTGVVHIGSERRTVYDYAKSVSPEKDIKQMSIKDMKANTPKDTSLDTTLYKSFCGE